MDIHWH